jgi:ligand-binding sensor domain-containing protein/signal transduction histidine kinase
LINKTIHIRLFFFFLLYSSLLQAQNKRLYEAYSLTYFGPPKSLPGREIRSVSIDRHGIAWIGTSVGLARFDGYNTQFFRNAPAERLSLSSNYINGVAADSAGYVWVATSNGLNVLTPGLRNIQYYLTDLPMKNNISDVAVDRTGQVWMCDNGRLAMVRMRKEGVFEAQYVAGDYNAHKILCGQDQVIWCSSRSGMEILKVQNGQLKKRYDTGIKTGERLVPFDPGDGSFAFVTKHLRQTALAYDPVADRFVLVQTEAQATQTGDSWFPGQIKQYIEDNRAFFKSDALIDNLELFCSRPDQWGNIWVCTNVGLFVARKISRQFEHFALLRGQSMRQMYETEKGLYFSFYGGTLHFNPATGTWKTIETDNPIMAYLPDDRGGVYTIGEFNGINYLTGSGSDVYSSQVIGNMPSHSLAAYALTPGRWLMQNKGLGVFDAQRRSFTYLDTTDVTGVVRTLAADQTGQVWIGTDVHGLYRYSPQNDRVTPFKAADKAGAPPTAVTTLFFQNGQFWLGSIGQGLYRFDPRTERITAHYSQNEGLINNTVNAILPDEQGRLWLSTDKGLSCFDPGKEIFVNYSTEDGLENTEFNRNSALRTRDGRLYFGGLNGVTAFDPDSVRRSAQIPSVFISKIVHYKGETETLDEYYPVSPVEESVVLEPNDKFIEFHLGSTLYMDAADNRFSFRLLPGDKKWAPLSANPVIRYTNLPPGQYTLQFKTVSPAGFDSKVLELELQVRQSFFKSGQFYALLIGLGILLAYSIYEVRIRQIKAIYKLRRRIADDLHDDVATLLNQVVMVVKSALRDPGLQDKTRQQLEKAEYSGEESLSKLGDIVWSIDEQQQSLGDLVNRLNDYAQTMFAARQIPCTQDISLANPRKILNAHIRNQILAIFKEAVNNAARHSAEGHAKYLIHNIGNDIRIEIENHVAQREFPLHSGQTGLERMKRRATQIGADFLVRQENDTYIISLKIDRVFR